MTFRRGFKTEAATLARETRVGLRLSPYDCLDPRILARRLGIPILALSDLAAACRGARYLLETEPEAFSAATVFNGHHRTIVYNDSHSHGRQNNSLAHELSHCLLLHEPTPALDGMTGCRVWNAANEKEADWLAGELLVTEAMALAVARGQITRREAQQRLGVSKQMLQWRLNMTGAYKRIQRARAG